jgi:hypothetical protein
MVMTNPDIKEKWWKKEPHMKVGEFHYDPKYDRLRDGTPHHGCFIFSNEGGSEVWWMCNGFRVSKGTFMGLVQEGANYEDGEEWGTFMTSALKDFYHERFSSSDNLFRKEEVVDEPSNDVFTP